jgi:hypothetical protein
MRKRLSPPKILCLHYFRFRLRIGARNIKCFTPHAAFRVLVDEADDVHFITVELVHEKTLSELIPDILLQD